MRAAVLFAVALFDDKKSKPEFSRAAVSHRVAAFRP
jgi:hypothetical protein